MENNFTIKIDKKKGKQFIFTKAQLVAHNKRLKESAYKKAAQCTVEKLSLLANTPATVAIWEISKYALYLVNEYNIKSLRK